MRIIVRITLIAFLCGAFPSAVRAVELTDGEAVGSLFGYAAMCCKNIHYAPPASNDDQRVGEKYAVWVKNNTRNPMKTMNDFQMGISLGMAAAAQSDYANCEPVLRELIGFYEYFDQSGESYEFAWRKYKGVSAEKSAPEPLPRREAPCIQKVIGTFTSEAIYLGYDEAEGMGSANFEIDGEYMYMNATEEEVIQYFDDRPGAKVRVTYETTQGPFEGKCLKWHELKGGQVAAPPNR